MNVILYMLLSLSLMLKQAEPEEKHKGRFDQLQNNLENITKQLSGIDQHALQLDLIQKLLNNITM